MNKISIYISAILVIALGVAHGAWYLATPIFFSHIFHAAAWRVCEKADGWIILLSFSQIIWLSLLVNSMTWLLISATMYAFGLYLVTNKKLPAKFIPSRQ